MYTQAKLLRLTTFAAIIPLVRQSSQNCGSVLQFDMDWPVAGPKVDTLGPRLELTCPFNEPRREVAVLISADVLAELDPLQTLPLHVHVEQQ